jgi:hypothetical protein
MRRAAVTAVFILSACLWAGAQDGHAGDGIDSDTAAASSTTPDFQYEALAGAGWDALFNDAFAAFMAANGMPALDPLRTWHSGWRFTFGTGRFYGAVASTRMSNFLFGPYGDSVRARMVWDSTELLLGGKLVDTETITWRAGAGVAVSKILLQAYGLGSGDFASVFASGGQADLVASGVWTAEIETLLEVRLTYVKEDDLGVWLAVGATAGWLPLDASWKLFDDPVITGVPRPFEFYVRPALWVGIR